MDKKVEIRVVIGRAVRGNFPVSVVFGEEVLLAGEVNPHRGASISSFVRRAEEAIPSLDAGDLRSKLLQLAKPRTAGTPAGADPAAAYYAATPDGLVWMKPTANGPTPVPLTNFTAEIFADVTRDDGTESEHAFAIKANLKNRDYEFTVSAAKFAAMNWPLEYMGAGAIVHAGMGAKDHARAAIQTLSKKPIRRVVYTHSGWRRIDGEMAYLHAGGAIGRAGRVEGVDVDLPDALSGYRLPDPDTKRTAEYVRASLRLTRLGRPEVTWPAFCAVYRAPLGPCDMALHFAGPTGVFKSELAALCQQHFGPQLDARRVVEHG